MTSAMPTQPLDTLTLPMAGSRLIEASAGTGKTFTIAGLYVRLLLGHQTARPLTCEQILVVTFTNAATGELRDRIRRKIQQAYRRFLGLDTDDELLDALYEFTPEAERPLALKRLDLALKSLDEAAIFTIHGFCQRILADMAFESSLLFESEFTLDDREFLHHAVRDFWREHCYGLPPYLAEIIHKKFADPDALARQLRPLLGASQACVQPTPADLPAVQEALSQNLTELKQRWPGERDALATLLHTLPLNGSRFGKKADGFPKLDALFTALDHWCELPAGLPPEKPLEQLSLSTLKLNKGGVLPSPEQAPVLAHIERLCAMIDAFVPSFLYCARHGISQRFSQQKTERNVLTPDDLLITLNEALHRHGADERRLAAGVAARFPVALIDEFQDTDPLQFAIFKRIYQQQAGALRTTGAGHRDADAISPTPLSLLLIGDPKQAIYAFRGADIHTYIQARAQISEHYSLTTNYRSSGPMIASVNALFGHREDPFISESIPFEPVAPSPLSDNKSLIEQSGLRSALRIKLLAEDPEKGLNKITARARLGDDAAAEITRLLNESRHGQCTLNGKPLKARDIAVLVRDRHEASVIKAALSARQVGAVFLSRDSVFNTVEATEMALVLRALASPKDERALRSAMATTLLGYDAQAIHAFNEDELIRQDLLEQFAALHHNWLARGIMPALLNLANDTRLIERLLRGEDGERRLTNFRHLAELLQQQASELDGISALLNWYEQALIDNNGNEEVQLRLESEQNLVQIVTIHKSKGLEYPVCFIPFVSLARGSNRKPAPMLYHQHEQLIWDIEQTDDGWQRHQREALAEDLRLLYVAITRPVCLCYLSIANQSRYTKKSGITSTLHETGIGYLLGIDDKACDFARLDAQARVLVSDAISVVTMAAKVSDDESSDDEESTRLLERVPGERHTLAPKDLQRRPATPWRVGSYSGLVKDLPHERAAPGADDEAFPELEVVTDPIDTAASRFSFERGANAGSFMHQVLELIDFTRAEAELAAQLPATMEKYGIDSSWLATLAEWYLDVLAAPLLDHAPQQSAQSDSPADALTLGQLSNRQKLVEMEFYLPIGQLQAAQLNGLLERYGYSAGLNFATLQGMLKGFVDLIFEHQGRYFIADYKSNHLGDSIGHYDTGAMRAAIRSHRYDLQYIIYTLALHRYLGLRMPDYDYHQHIGGSYYLFLRGMSAGAPSSGVFYDKPPKALIDELDQLFEQGHTPAAAQDEAPAAAHHQLEMKL